MLNIARSLPVMYTSVALVMSVALTVKRASATLLPTCPSISGSSCSAVTLSLGSSTGAVAPSTSATERGESEMIDSERTMPVTVAF